MFPMNDEMNLEIQIVGETRDEVFQIKKNNVGCRWIHITNEGQ